MAAVSSCREMLLSPGLRRNLFAFSCHHVWVGTLKEPLLTSRRKAVMTSSPHGPACPGLTRATMAVTAGSQIARSRDPEKPSLARIALCKLGCMKRGITVIADQHAAVNTFPGLGHRHYPSHHWSWFDL